MESKRILIVSLNSQYIHSSLAPWCLLAGIKAYSECYAKIDVRIHEGTVNETADKNLSDITKESPNIIGFCCYIWNITRIKELLPKIKQLLPNAKIILGGPEVSYNQKQVFNEIPETDFIISGEGEKPFALLIDSLILGNALPEGFGISDKLIIAEPYISAEEPPSPYCDEYFERLKGRISYIETSRGCPFSCAFCLSGRCGKARFFELEKSITELTKLANSGTKTIKFVDRTFNANKAHAKHIIKYICENYGGMLPQGVCFHFEMAGDILDDELITILNSAPKGSIQLEIGMQSFNEKTLAAIDRKTDTKILRRNLRRLISPGNIHIHIDLIAGLPFEDLKSFGESFNTAFELRANMLQMGFLKILHGAPMDTEKDRFPCNYSSDPPYEVSSTPWLSGEDIALLHLAENALDRLWCSGRFRQSCDRLIELSGQSPFEFFISAGKKLHGIKTPADICAKLMEYTEENYPKHKAELRDVLVLDWMSSNSSGRLPESIVRHDPELKKFIVSLENKGSTKREKGVKRSANILYTMDKFVYADYKAEDMDPVSGRYPLTFIERNRWYSA